MAEADLHEILPGVWHWTSHHEGIGARVSSYLVEPAGIALDPLLPEGGLEALADRPPVQQVVLTSGLHTRHAERFAEHFGCPIRAPREAAERLGDRLAFEPYDARDDVAPGVRAIHIGALCPDEYALHLDVEGGAIALADALVRYGGTLSYVPDGLMGDDPAAVRAGLRDSLRGLLTRDFDALLLAHGEPLVGGAKSALREFVEDDSGAARGT